MLFDGEVAERFMAAVLKTVDRKVRGFESLPLRHVAILVAATLMLGCALLPTQVGAPTTPTPFSGVPRSADTGPTPTPHPPTLDPAWTPEPVRTYVSTSVTKDGAPFPLVFGTHIEFSLTETSAGGTAACQRQGGTATIVDGHLHMGESGMTLIGCPPDHQAQDDWFAAFLTATPAITFDGDRLRLESGGVVIDLIDKASVMPNPLIESEWVLTSIQENGVDMPLPAGFEATVSFSDQGFLSWYMGCAVGASYYERAGPGQASLWFMMRPTDSRPRSCGSSAFVEEAFQSTLSSIDVPFRIDNKTLTLSGPDRTLVFKRR
jgi:heat shock protein HslJ